VSGSFERPGALDKVVMSLPVEVTMSSVARRSVASKGSARRVEAKQEALAWLAAELRWERALDRLRGTADDDAVPQAA